jgi:hypothetical protein
MILVLSHFGAVLLEVCVVDGARKPVGGRGVRPDLTLRTFCGSWATLNGNKDPKRTCWITGNFASTWKSTKLQNWHSLPDKYTQKMAFTAYHCQFNNKIIEIQYMIKQTSFCFDVHTKINFKILMLRYRLRIEIGTCKWHANSKWRCAACYTFQAQ